MKTTARFAFLFLGILVLTSCAQSVSVEACTPEEVYGFWGGLWHGIIAPFTFIVSLFDDEVAMYAINNNGGWYNFGFVLGAGILFGSGHKGSRKVRK